MFDGRVRLSLAPVSTLHAIRLTMTGAAPAIVDAAHYGVDRASGEFWFLSAAPLLRQAHGGIEIEYDAGYGAASDAPIDLRQAVLIAFSALYENRAETAQVTASIAGLVAPYQRVRL
jgi:uncharacterized phiE125 gp8 family phage protein